MENLSPVPACHVYLSIITHTVYNAVTHTVYNAVTHTVYNAVTHTVYNAVTHTVYNAVKQTVKYKISFETLNDKRNIRVKYLNTTMLEIILKKL